MSSNFRRNKAFIGQYRKDLRSMFGDIREIDKKCLNKAVNIGVAYAKRNTNVDTGFMRKSWHASRTEIKPDAAEKSLYNTADYSSFYNDGHRLVDGAGATVGFVKGKYVLERTNDRVEKSLIREFKKEIEGVSRKHDK